MAASIPVVIFALSGTSLNKQVRLFLPLEGQGNQPLAGREFSGGNTQVPIARFLTWAQDVSKEAST